MAVPHYVRRREDSESSEYKDSLEDEVDSSKKIKDDGKKLFVTGLREKKLLCLIIYVIIIFIIAFGMLSLNILLINVLQMNARGMRSLHFHNYIDPDTNQQLTMVDFSGEKINLGHIIAKSGRVYGEKDKNMRIEGSRIIIRSGEKGPSYSMSNGVCKIENAEDFHVLNRDDGKILFSARNPLVMIDKKIKKISTKNIVTNKIRSPINEELNISGENINLRGNEGILLDSKNINVTIDTALRLKTSLDGSLRIISPSLRFADTHKTLPLSSSPALTASVDAFKVCICNSARPKLFIVQGNKPCIANTNICL
uniref:Beta-sarcoglycan n=1 Tax=Strongyloides venezuelensis TaxID=75913 RepID=A0A0K0F926_STRVS